MTRLAVVMYRCNGCKCSDEPAEKDPRFPNSRVMNKRELLPPEWIAFKTVSNMGDGDTYHFCPKCATELSRLILGLSLDSKEVEDLGVPLIDDPTNKEE